MNPISWWIIPRSATRDDRFYERNVRGISFLLISVLVLASIVLIPQGVLAGYELLLVGMILVIVVPTIAVSQGHLIISGWILSSILMFVGMTTLVTSGYWAPNAVGIVLVIPILTALLVRSNRAKLLFIIVITVLFGSIAYYQQSTGFVSIFDPSYSQLHR